MLWLFALLLSLCVSCNAEIHVFQGWCSSSSSVCEEICISLTEESYECACWNGNPLNDDGVSCKAIDSSEHLGIHHDKKNVRKVKIEDDSWMETIKTATPSLNFTDQTDDDALSFDSHNYAHFTSPASAYLETNVSIEFRSDSLDDGLLFFGGMYTEEDFLSLAIVGGNVVLRYDCGEGISTETYFGPFSLHRWHFIRIKRKYCTRSEITVDAMATIMDNNEIYKNYKGISMSDGFFLGGAPADVEFLEGKTTVSRGFKGCVRRLSVNELILLDVSKGINAMLNREMIKSCRTDNVTRKEESEGMVVRKIDLHHVDKRILETSSTTTKTTTQTNAPTTVQQPIHSPRNLSVEFNGGLFLEQPSPIEMEQYIDIEIHFKPKKNKGLLFHWEDRSHRLSIFLLDGFVEVDMSLGGDDTLLRSPSSVSLNSWHSVQVYRSGKGILMKVDKQRFVDTEVESTDRRRIKAGSTFIGGSNIKLPASIQAVGNYVGCMKKIRLNSHLLSLSHSPSRTADADRQLAVPTLLPLCSSDPCSSRGKCSPHDCASSEDLTKYSCLCHFPSFGERCGSTFSMAEGAMRLRGNGFVQLNDPVVMEHITGDSLKFSMEIKQNGTIEKEQILAYAGDIEDDDDFMQIGLNKERKIVVKMNLGAGEVQLTHSRPIAAGKWTTIDVVRTKRSIRVTVDGEAPVTVEAPAGSEQLNVYDSIFIGGRESHVHLRDDGFEGCIEWIKIDDTVITSPRQATKSINVEPCHSLT